MCAFSWLYVSGPCLLMVVLVFFWHGCVGLEMLSKKVLKMQFLIVILALYGMSHSCDECLLMVNSALKGNILNHRYLFQTILSHPEAAPIQSGRFPLKPFLIFGKKLHQG